MSHPVVQEVIKSHEDKMNILHLWRDICEIMDRIMMIDIKPLNLLDSLTNKENKNDQMAQYPDTIYGDV
jgi:hypothetical protein